MNLVVIKPTFLCIKEFRCLHKKEISVKRRRGLGLVQPV